MRFGHIVQIGLFMAFLYAGLGLMLMFGGKDELSETENRTLATMPEWSKRTVWSGIFFRDLENYVADHVAFRDKLVGLSRCLTPWRGLAGQEDTLIVASNADNTGETAAEVQPEPSDSRETVPSASSDAPSQAAKSAVPEPSKKPEEPGRVIGKVLIAGNRAMNLFAYAPAAGQAYADTINAFQRGIREKLGDCVRISVLIAPTAAEFESSKTLKGLSDSQRNAIESVYGKLHPSIAAVDAVSALQEHAGEPLYFRTDHHWTATGAYYAYAAFMTKLGMKPVPLSDYRTEDVPGFLGSLHSSTLNKKLEGSPDTIVLYKPFVNHTYTVYYEGPLKMNLLDMTHAQKKNKYRIFLSGDRPWAKIETESAGGRRIAVVKDSYGNAFVPFLLPHFKEIYVIDPRQFQQPLADFIAKHEIGEVLFLNNAEVAMYTGFSETIRKRMTP